MQIFVINLPESKDRLAFQQSQMARLGLEFELVRAVSPSHLHTRARHYMAIGWERPLRKTEIACYLSHHKIWQLVHKRQQPALILEDDAMLSRHVPYLLRQLDNYGGCDLVKFEVRGRKKTVARRGKNILGEYHLLPLFQDSIGAAAYVLWPSGAEILLERAQDATPGLVDAFISTTYKLNAYQLEPAAAVQLDACEHYGVGNKIKFPSTIFHEPLPDVSYLTLYERWQFHKRRMLARTRARMRTMAFRNESITRQIKLDPDDFL
ncbi:MAG: glycosyltransferase family 25 protein [Thiothrix sp.]|nr:glycosyltransferase family 25 protein [Thiothrix sp.]HPQ96759.1 glycosyltransferase family 25 protein [Thiolinea sp.]